MTTMETMAVLELHYTLGFLSAAGAFGVLAWCLTALRPQRGYILPVLLWLANLLLYSLVVLLRFDGVAASAPTKTCNTGAVATQYGLCIGTRIQPYSEGCVFNLAEILFYSSLINVAQVWADIKNGYGL